MNENACRARAERGAEVDEASFHGAGIGVEGTRGRPLTVRGPRGPEARRRIVRGCGRPDE
jgi:hypothetical protein